MVNVYQTREAAIYGGIIDLLETRFANAVTGFDVEAIARRVLRKEHGGYTIDETRFWDAAASNAIVSLPHLS
jgi:hypothetical protein